MELLTKQVCQMFLFKALNSCECVLDHIKFNFGLQWCVTNILKFH